MRRTLRELLVSQIVGLRYFNVYGPREQHKGRMASVAFHHFNQYRDSGKVRLFGEYGGYAPGQQARDFIYVDDVVAVNLWFLAHPQSRGVFNLGTGRAQAFNDVAHATVNACRAQRAEPALTLEQQVEQGMVEYIPIPEALVGKYQCHTQADLSALRAAGCRPSVCRRGHRSGRYVEWLSGGCFGLKARQSPMAAIPPSLLNKILPSAEIAGATGRRPADGFHQRRVRRAAPGHVVYLAAAREPWGPLCWSA